MRNFEITWFQDSRTGKVGIPHTTVFKGRDYQEAKTQFEYHYPTQTVYSWCEIE